ncbi:MAG: hypothetical protein NVS3B20_25980 [Polyangiales bacterium]
MGGEIQTLPEGEFGAEPRTRGKKQGGRLVRVCDLPTVGSTLPNGAKPANDER